MKSPGPSPSTGRSRTRIAWPVTSLMRRPRSRCSRRRIRRRSTPRSRRTPTRSASNATIRPWRPNFETKGATGFRNGTQNLHAVHVNDKVKGRTCRACHAPHGADLPHLIRASVPFGPSRLAVADPFPGDEDRRQLRPRMPRSEGLRPRETGKGVAVEDRQSERQRSHRDSHHGPAGGRRFGHSASREGTAGEVRVRIGVARAVDAVHARQDASHALGGPPGGVRRAAGRSGHDRGTPAPPPRWRTPPASATTTSLTAVSCAASSPRCGESWDPRPPS